jgi:hypothetical protein
VALFNEILVGRFNRFSQKHFSLKGSAGTPTLSADLAVQIPLNNGVENRYLEGWDLFSRAVIATSPGVGNQLFGVLRNPKTSGVIAAVTRASWAEATATNSAANVNSQLSIAPTAITVDQGTTFNGVAWDNRGRTFSSLIVSFNPALQVGLSGNTGIAFGAVAAFTFVEFIPWGAEIPLAPGETLLMGAGNNNSAANFIYWWRERVIEDSEKF